MAEGKWEETRKNKEEILWLTERKVKEKRKKKWRLVEGKEEGRNEEAADEENLRLAEKKEKKKGRND